MALAATLSLDLDDLWAYRASFGLPAAAASLLPLAIARYLRLMGDHGLQGTVFVVGRDAERPALKPLLAELASAGHELGNHSHAHAADLQAWPAARQRDDLARAHAAIAAAGGRAPVGFRGPAFQASAGLLQTVQALGYRYDSSMFPNALAGLARRWQARRARALGSAVQPAAGAHGAGAVHRLPLAPWAWDLPGGGLVEVPITTLPGLRLPLHGTYLQHLADHSPATARAFLRGALALCAARGVAPHYLLHATDFVGCEDGFEVGFLPGMRRPWRAKVALLDRLLGHLRKRFAPTTLAHYVARIGPADSLPRRDARRLDRG